jgi:hypothetical protein
MSHAGGSIEEVRRIRRVSDSLCSAHASIRDKLARRAFLLDLLILGLATWLVGLTFIEPNLSFSLTPFGLDSRVWLGTLSIATFFLSIVQLKTDWKGRAESHDRTLGAYAAVKREAGYLLAAGNTDEAALKRVIDRYDMASSICVPVPESEFLKQKRRHVTKVALSRHLDTHPSASLALTRVRYWCRDNFGDGHSA